MRKGLFGFALVLALIQLVPAKRTNPPVESQPLVEPEVLSVLRRSCYDCHSHETRWPWYAKVAPSSWFVVHDVNEAREHLNFSRWDDLVPREQEAMRHEIWEEVEIDRMPLWYYLRVHQNAVLSEADRQVLRRWASVSDR